MARVRRLFGAAVGVKGRASETGFAAKKPQSAAAAMIMGKGRENAKMPTKASPAVTQAARDVSALRETFNSACSTITMTVALMPTNTPLIQWAAMQKPSMRVKDL